MNANEYYRELGMVASLLARSSVHRHFPISHLEQWLKPPILLRQIQFLRNKDAKLMGYITWSLMSEETEKRWVSNREPKLHASEWNEGDRLWIIDFFLVEGDVRTVINHLASRLFEGHLRGRSLRRNADGTARKVMTWTRR